MKVMCIFGTRPEAIKLAPVIRELQQQSESGELQTIVCVTGQHRQMLDQVLHLFGIVPDYDLGVMKDNQTPTQVASFVLARLEPVLQTEQPDWVLVQGDTTTVVAASLAAFFARVKVGHVEAGLRTADKWHPFPEEVNRRVASVIADLHFAPTERAHQNLMREGVPDERILLTGNPVIDALHWVSRQPPTPEVYKLFQQCGLYDGNGKQKTIVDTDGPADVLPRLTNNDRRIILVTAHRRENFGRPLENICLALKDIATSYSDEVNIVYPVHLNPNVRETVHRLLGNISNITLTPPLDYLPLTYLMKHSYLVLTDSGGIQEEAPGLGKPVLVLRRVTERPEAVEAGTAQIVGTDRERIVNKITQLLENVGEYNRMARAVNPYGDGHAAKRVVQALLERASAPFEPVGMLRVAD